MWVDHQEDQPYCVMAVSIDELQQLALKLLQGRLEGDGQSVQGEGQHLEQLRPQQSISCCQYRGSINISTTPWHLHDCIKLTALVCFQCSSVGFVVKDTRLKNKVKLTKRVEIYSTYSYLWPICKVPWRFQASPENLSWHPRSLRNLKERGQVEKTWFDTESCWFYLCERLILKSELHSSMLLYQQCQLSAKGLVSKNTCCFMAALLINISASPWPPKILHFNTPRMYF